MANNVDEFLVFPVRSDATVSKPRTQPAPAGSFCASCGAEMSPQDVFCQTCGARVGNAQQSQVQSQSYQPAVGAQAVPHVSQSLPYQQAQQAQPILQTQATQPLAYPGTKKSRYPRPKKLGSNPGIGVVLLIVGVALIITCFMVGTTYLGFQWWQVFVSFLWEFPYAFEKTVVAFILPFILVGGGILALVGIACFFPDPEEGSDNNK